MLEKIVIWLALKGRKADKRPFNKSQEIQAWLTLSENEMVMNKLLEWQEFNQEAIRALLVLNKDKKDLEKAKMLGRLDIIATILEKINQAKKYVQKR